jgi:hypothetical protein
MNIAILLPCTSNKRNYRNLKETDLYSYFFKTFFTTYNQEHNYTIYLGIDENDKFYNNLDIEYEIKKYVEVMKNTNIYIYKMNERYKSNPAGIWTFLYKQAYTQNDYFIQVGSDIYFLDNNWVNIAIDTLQQNNNLGVVGLTDEGRKELDPNDKLLTQSIVSKKHFDIYGFYFPPEIKNWCCDDWITQNYQFHNLVYYIPHRFYNLGGQPRYEITNFREQYNCAMLKYQNNIRNYLRVNN